MNQERLCSAACIFIRRCHTKMLSDSLIQAYFPIRWGPKNVHVLYVVQIIGLPKLLKLEKLKTKRKTRCFFCPLVTGATPRCKCLHILFLSHSWVVYITTGVLPNLKQLKSNIFKGLALKGPSRHTHTQSDEDTGFSPCRLMLTYSTISWAFCSQEASKYPNCIDIIHITKSNPVPNRALCHSIQPLK